VRPPALWVRLESGLGRTGLGSRSSRRSLALLFFGGLGRLDADLLEHFAFDALTQVCVLTQKDTYIFPALTEALIAIAEPSATLLDDLVINAEIDEVALA
jgi:hypothetical protein